MYDIIILYEVKDIMSELKTLSDVKQSGLFGTSNFDNIINAGLDSKLDISEIQAFTQASQNRNLIYDLLDTMCEDPTIAAVLETYAEDATEYNDNGQIVWCESSNSDVAAYSPVVESKYKILKVQQQSSMFSILRTSLVASTPSKV